MPSRTNRDPAYRHHKTSDRAVVTLNGRDIYLGRYGTPESKAKYYELLAKWHENGGVLPGARDKHDYTVLEMLADYKRFAESHYRKNGKLTKEYFGIMDAVKFVRELYETTAAKDFGPLALKAVRTRMVSAGISRQYVNKQTSRIRRIFKWAVENELVPADNLTALQSVAPLKAGRTDARETERVQPVPDDVVNATLEYLPEVIADMVRFQRLTGCRPQQVRLLRPCELARYDEQRNELPVWEYRPGTHKTEHHGKTLVIFIGPRAQAVLRPYLVRSASETDYVFSPREAERRRRAEVHAKRKTPQSCGNRPGSNVKADPRHQPGEFYTEGSYGQAISRACDKAFPPPAELKGDKLKAWRKQHRWSPNQLRHTAATEIRKRYGIEAARVTLGHSSAETSEIYAERDLAKAAEIMAEVG